MRKIILGLALLVATICANTITAQLGPTYFKPFNYQSYNEKVNIPMRNGFQFAGTKYTSTINGKVSSVSYMGSVIFPDGGRLITAKAGYGFNQNLQFTNGTIWKIEPTGEVTEIVMQNNREVSSYSINRQYVIEDNCIVFVKSQAELEAAAGYSAPTNSSSYSNGSSGSSYNRHEATCRGCNGSGLCQHCHGSGYVNNNKSKCSLCSGRGRCVSCGGQGKIH